MALVIMASSAALSSAVRGEDRRDEVVNASLLEWQDESQRDPANSGLNWNTVSAWSLERQVTG
jgi:hypothetical protein